METKMKKLSRLRSLGNESRRLLGAGGGEAEAAGVWWEMTRSEAVDEKSGDMESMHEKGIWKLRS